MNKVRRSVSFLFIFGLVLGVFVFEGVAQRRNSSDLIGTYKLDAKRSENISDIVEGATRNNNTSAANKEDLKNKLEAPEIVAIDIRGDSVTLSTSEAKPVKFTADGSTQTSTRADGTTVRVKTSLVNGELIISSVGGETDYTLTFTSIDDGKGLRVTRRITTDYLRYTVFADSIYNKTDSVARINGSKKDDDGYSSSDTDNDPNYPRTKNAKKGNFIVPKGVVLTGTLENKISTRASQNNDKFGMIVELPGKYAGAVIEGYLSDVKRSGRVSGRSTFTMNFETIRMPDGRTYDFAGVLKSATDKSGKIIRVGQEGDAKGGSQTKESVKRGGIGAGLGAIIGAIIGGGKGAIIGAIIGGGVGTGSVISQGRGDVELERGSVITVESTSPNK